MQQETRNLFQCDQEYGSFGTQNQFEQVQRVADQSMLSSIGNASIANVQLKNYEFMGSGRINTQNSHLSNRDWNQEEAPRTKTPAVYRENVGRGKKDSASVRSNGSRRSAISAKSRDRSVSQKSRGKYSNEIADFMKQNRQKSIVKMPPKPTASKQRKSSNGFPTAQSHSHRQNSLERRQALNADFDFSSQKEVQRSCRMSYLNEKALEIEMMEQYEKELFIEEQRLVKEQAESSQRNIQFINSAFVNLQEVAVKPSQRHMMNKNFDSHHQESSTRGQLVFCDDSENEENDMNRMNMIPREIHSSSKQLKDQACSPIDPVEQFQYLDEGMEYEDTEHYKMTIQNTMHIDENGGCLQSLGIKPRIRQASERTANRNQKIVQNNLVRTNSHSGNRMAKQRLQQLKRTVKMHKTKACGVINKDLPAQDGAGPQKVLFEHPPRPAVIRGEATRLEMAPKPQNIISQANSVSRNTKMHDASEKRHVSTTDQRKKGTSFGSSNMFFFKGGPQSQHEIDSQIYDAIPQSSQQHKNIETSAPLELDQNEDPDFLFVNFLKSIQLYVQQPESPKASNGSYLHSNLQFLRQKYKQFLLHHRSVANSSRDNNFDIQSGEYPALCNENSYINQSETRSAFPRNMSRLHDQASQQQEARNPTPVEAKKKTEAKKMEKSAFIQMPQKQQDQINFIDNIYKNLVLNKTDKRNQNKMEQAKKAKEAQVKLMEINHGKTEKMQNREKPWILNTLPTPQPVQPSQFLQQNPSVQRFEGATIYTMGGDAVKQQQFMTYQNNPSEVYQTHGESAFFPQHSPQIYHHPYPVHPAAYQEQQYQIMNQDLMSLTSNSLNHHLNQVPHPGTRNDQNFTLCNHTDSLSYKGTEGHLTTYQNQHPNGIVEMPQPQTNHSTLSVQNVHGIDEHMTLQQNTFYPQQMQPSEQTTDFVPQQMIRTIQSNEDGLNSSHVGGQTIQSLVSMNNWVGPLAQKSTIDSNDQDLMGQVQLLQRQIGDPNSLSANQIAETMAALNETAGELKKACQGITEFASSLNKRQQEILRRSSHNSEDSGALKRKLADELIENPYQQQYNSALNRDIALVQSLSTDRQSEKGTGLPPRDSFIQHSYVNSCSELGNDTNAFANHEQFQRNEGGGSSLYFQTNENQRSGRPSTEKQQFTTRFGLKKSSIDYQSTAARDFLNHNSSNQDNGSMNLSKSDPNSMRKSHRVNQSIIQQLGKETQMNLELLQRGRATPSELYVQTAQPSEIYVQSVPPSEIYTQTQGTAELQPSQYQSQSYLQSSNRLVAPQEISAGHTRNGSNGRYFEQDRMSENMSSNFYPSQHNVNQTITTIEKQNTARINENEQKVQQKGKMQKSYGQGFPAASLPISHQFTPEMTQMGSMAHSQESSVAYLEKMLRREQPITSSQPTIITNTESHSLHYTLHPQHNVSQESGTANNSMSKLSSSDPNQTKGFLGNTLQKENTLSPEQFEKLLKQMQQSQQLSIKEEYYMEDSINADLNDMHRYQEFNQLPQELNQDRQDLDQTDPELLQKLLMAGNGNENDNYSLKSSCTNPSQIQDVFMIRGGNLVTSESRQLGLASPPSWVQQATGSSISILSQSKF